MAGNLCAFIDKNLYVSKKVVFVQNNYTSSNFFVKVFLQIQLKTLCLQVITWGAALAQVYSTTHVWIVLYETITGSSPSLMTFVACHPPLLFPTFLSDHSQTKAIGANKKMIC